MGVSALLEDIREANLSYLLLAQRLIRDDKPEALARLGISEHTADLIDQLTTAQLLKIVSQEVLMCNLRFDDPHIWDLLTNPHRDQQVSGLHAAILMSGQTAEH
jgi:flagellar transcriptional activator FlhD